MSGELPIGVLTRSYTNDRAGVNGSETILTAQAVAKRGVKRLYSLPIPGDARGAEAQPLIVPGVKLANGQVHDLVLISSLANQVLAYDHSDGKLLWAEQLSRPVKSTPAIDSWQINDNIGVLSTPVVDRSNEMLYACSWASPDGSVARAQHYLEAVSLVSGKRARSSLNLEGAVFDPGGGVPVQRFASAARKQRASLLQLGQTVFVGFGSIWESAASNRGWVIAIDVKQWKVTAAWCTAVEGSGGGIWQAGAGLAADAAGDIVLMTGNGDFDAQTEWGECVIKLRYTPPGPALLGELNVVDHWSPFLDSARVAPAEGEVRTPIFSVDGPKRSPTNTRRYTMVSAERMDAAGNIPLSFGQADDMDLGSGGPVVLDELGIALAAGKDGILYAVRLNAMGGTTAPMLAQPAGVAENYGALAAPPLWWTFFPGWSVSPSPTDIRSINYLYGGTTHHQHGSPIAWKSPQGWRLACWGENSTLRLWGLEASPAAPPLVPGVKISYLATGDIVASAQATVPPGGMPGAPMTLSWDGKNADTAVIWACVPYFDANRVVSPAQLVAYGANDIAAGQIRKLWTSEQWNLPFTLAKFTGPVVWGGKVYVPTFDARTDVYGLA